MPASQSTGRTGRPAETEEEEPAVRTFEASPEPEGPPPREPEEGPPGRPTTLLTVIAILAAIVLATLSVVLPLDLVGDPGVLDMVIVGTIALVVALGGMLPIRWGWYIVPLVALAHYGLNFYNIVLSEQSVYGFVPGDAFGYAILGPGIGVVLGFVLQGVYNLIVQE